MQVVKVVMLMLKQLPILRRLVMVHWAFLPNRLAAVVVMVVSM